MQLLVYPETVFFLVCNSSRIRWQYNTNVRPKKDKKQIKMALSDLQLKIIDEIFVVSNTLLLHIHQQLKEILSTSNNCLFAGLSIITVGDLY